MAIRARFIFKDSFQGIIKKINEAAIRKLTRQFYSSEIISGLEEVVRKEVINSIKQTSVWKSLHGNAPRESQLDAHFGIVASQRDQRLDNILNIWAKEILVRPQHVKRKPQTFVLSYKLYAIHSDWAQVLASNDGVTINNSKRFSGQRLHWLSWLLRDGSIEVTGYHIKFGNFPGNISRSTKAIMIPQFSWRVPEEYGVATTNDNFVTRALDELVQQSNFKQRISDVILGKLGGNDLLSLLDSILI